MRLLWSSFRKRTLRLSVTAATVTALVHMVQDTHAMPSFTYDDYAVVLKTHVNDKGWVSYRKLKTNPAPLDRFTQMLAALDPNIYAQWNDTDKIALLINAYNAFTLKAIVMHYPIQPSFLASLRFPKNSIRQIPGVWDRLTFALMGREVTLDEIEHQMLRTQFDEPRIHLALVCAAMGCPPLRNEPYVGKRLDAQLADQTRRFLNDPLKFHLNRREERVYLSSIFKWFGEDFVKTYGANGKFAGKNETESAALNFVSQYLEDDTRNYLATGRYTIEYLDYDWSLNEQPTAS